MMPDELDALRARWDCFDPHDADAALFLWNAAADVPDLLAYVDLILPVVQAAEAVALASHVGSGLLNDLDEAVWAYRKASGSLPE
jgi:hypothetical protein